MSHSETLKDYLSDPKAHIRLYDAVVAQVRTTAERLTAEHFPHNAAFSTEELVRRLDAYAKTIAPLQETLALLAHWANTKEQLSSLKCAITRLGELNRPEGGLTLWLSFRWYPVVRLLYAAGIASIAGDNYAALATLLMSPLPKDNSADADQEIMSKAVGGFWGSSLDEEFRRIPQHRDQRTPISEHFFEQLQPELEQAFYLGLSFPEHFDRFEVLLSLMYADLQRRKGRNAWGPVGRFGWKNRNIVNELIQEVEAHGDRWPPLKAGLFSGLASEFKLTADAFTKGVLAQLHWY